QPISSPSSFPLPSVYRLKSVQSNLHQRGIGGLGAEFADIFRRAFASRVFPPHVTSRLGIKHIVNGPEVLSKFVGETEKNVRDLFADAEQDQRTLGDASELHVIIFDEIDAICKSRGSTRDGTGVHDSIVNQLLTKIDGVEALNNVLLIGMTNRKDLLDEALLRFDENAWIGVISMFGRVQSLHSDRTLARARSLRSDRAGRALGRYVATELWLELGRYVATKWDDRSVAM
ncbi:hypothetical protein IGI04_042966, partial [Brassica rapa subsp. trilocularis]